MEEVQRTPRLSRGQVLAASAGAAAAIGSRGFHHDNMAALTIYRR